MAKKTFKIGEWAIGGIVQAETKKDSVKINVISDATKEVIMTKTFYANDDVIPYSDIDWYLFDVTSSYYSDKILTWIKAQFKIES